MSLLCGCAGRTRNTNSPKHSTRSNMSSSKLRPPSTVQGGGRFGFGAKSQRHSAPVKTPETSLELSTVRPDSTLTVGLALNPSALLSNSENDNLGGYVSRHRKTDGEGRPLSSIAAISESNSLVEDNGGIRPHGDYVSSLGKPKSGLRTHFSRLFQRDKPPASPVVVVQSTASRSKVNSSKSDGSLSALSKLSSRGSIRSTASTCSNNSSDSTSSKTSASRLRYKQSPVSSRGSNSSPTFTDGKAVQKVPQGSGHKPSHSKMVTPVTTQRTVTPLSKSTGSAKHSSQTKSVKASRPSYPMSKLNSSSTSSTAASNKQCLSNHNRPMANNVNELHNNNTPTDQCKEDTANIDYHSMSIDDIEAPVATADTDSETSFSTTEWSTSSCAARTSGTMPSNHRLTPTLPTTGGINGEKKKPTMEINPLTKQDNPNSYHDQHEQSDEMVLAEKRSMATTSSREYTIDEDMLSSIVSEISSLKSTIVELQHHLIGKQEHEDKMREELELKDEIIANLQSQLMWCTCPRKNGYTKVVEGDMPTIIQCEQ